MNIYVPEKHTPKNCYQCPLRKRMRWADSEAIVCPISHSMFRVDDVNILLYRMKDCPIVPVPDTTADAIGRIVAERKTQIAKWGETSQNLPFEWMSILGEEFGELCEAFNETYFVHGSHPERGGRENILREATQVAAVAAAIIEAFSAVNDTDN